MRVLAARIKGLPRGSQRVLAELAGLRAETITRWKGGQGNPKLGELEAFADALEVSVSYLIDAERDETPKIPPTGADERKLDRLLRDGERVRAELLPLLESARGRRR